MNYQMNLRLCLGDLIMKRYEDSIVSYRCETCTCTIYNATKEFTKCENCGGKLIKINKLVKDLKGLGE